MSAPYLTTNYIMHARTKHVEIDYHFIHDRVVQNYVLIQYTPFENQLANKLTKALPALDSLVFAASSLVTLRL